MRVERVDRDDFGKGRVELHEDRRARRHGLQVVDLGPGPADIDGVVDRILSVRHPVDLDHRIFVASRIVAGKFAERPFGLALPAKHAALQHVFGAPGHVQPLRRLDHPVRRALHHGRHLVFELVVEQRCRPHQRDQRLIAQRDRDRQVLAALFGMRHVDCDIVLRHGLDAQPVRSLDLQAIDADVLDVVVVPVVEIAADRRRPCR